MSTKNKYYIPGEQRAVRVTDLFGRIATRYDLINDLQSFGLHRMWKRRLVRLAAPQAGERALDLCCGTGDIAYRLAQKRADVSALDFSAPMLAVANGRGSNRAGEMKVRFVLGDAMKLPFEDASFDMVTVGYGLRNLADWEQGLREMWRVCKTGGRLLILDFGKPEARWWRWMYFTYLRAVVPVLGWTFAGDAQAYAYILESLRHFPAQQGVSAKLREWGAGKVEVHNSMGGAMSIVCGVRP